MEPPFPLNQLPSLNMVEPVHRTKAKLNLVRIALRIAMIMAVAYAIGFALTICNRYFERENRPAGFVRGMLHGATMPAAMPNLALGRDMTIFATNNNGIPYKLGYTMGVNICGAIFFGIFFLRVNRWKKARALAQGKESAKIE
jgi:hypothetical protein